MTDPGANDRPSEDEQELASDAPPLTTDPEAQHDQNPADPGTEAS
jgi:hypothetical protein